MPDVKAPVAAATPERAGSVPAKPRNELRDLTLDIAKATLYREKGRSPGAVIKEARAFAEALLAEFPE